NCWSQRPFRTESLPCVTNLIDQLKLLPPDTFCVLSKAITKELTQVAARLGRPPPHPRHGSVVESGGGHLHGSFNLIGEGCALARERIAAEQAPPPLL